MTKSTKQGQGVSHPPQNLAGIQMLAGIGHPLICSHTPFCDIKEAWNHPELRWGFRTLVYHLLGQLAFRIKSLSFSQHLVSLLIGLACSDRLGPGDISNTCHLKFWNSSITKIICPGSWHRASNTLGVSWVTWVPFVIHTCYGLIVCWCHSKINILKTGIIL